MSAQWDLKFYHYLLGFEVAIVAWPDIDYFAEI
jgi:hypothetical protein